MTTAKKPLTAEQKARKNARAKELAAEKKAQRDAARATAAAMPELPADEPARLSCSMVIYDIPSDNERYADPSATMRRIGFRVNLSCWVVPDGAVPHTFLHELRTKYRANVDVVRFDAAEGPRLAKMAVDAMKKEWSDNAKRSTEGIAAMEASHLALDADLTDNVEARRAALKVYEQRCRRILKKMNGIIEDVEVAIRNFGAAPEQIDTGTARTVYETLQTGYQAKAAAFVAATEALRKLGTTDATAMANAAAKDQAMPEPMIDMLRENGDDAAANALQAAFDRNIELASDDVFSLVGVGDDDTDAAA